MKRRQFLRTLGGASAAVAGFSLNNSLSFGFRTAQAHDLTSLSGGKTLVFVYLRGGNDGLNTVVPYGTGHDSISGYYRPGFRDTLAIAAPDLNNPVAALDLFSHTNPAASNFESPSAMGLGFHPALKEGLYKLYERGNLAVMPSVHYPDASRSHFSSQQFTESARDDLLTDGWLNRYLVDAGMNSTEAIRAVGLSRDLPHMLRGQEVVSVFSDLRQFNMGISDINNESKVLSRLRAIYNQTPETERKYSKLLHDFGQVTLKDLDVVNDLKSHAGLDPDTYVSANPSEMDYGSSTFHRQLKQTANLIKAGHGLEVASLSKGGFDYHRDQGGGDTNSQHYQNLKDVSDGLKAFFDDLSGNGSTTNYMDDVLVIVGSEFGRTSYENGSLGVDHGEATSWFTLGSTNNVEGGVYLGHRNETGTPGNTPITNFAAELPLADVNMNDGRFLKYTIDYRNIYGEIVDKFLIENYIRNGSSPSISSLLPGFSYEPGKVPFLI